ncbi:MAG: hypothetical protein JEY99_00455 [Spirochaetales bacterium]|nr:hypothetical protein [Spirochaetales bacterium]
MKNIDKELTDRTWIDMPTAFTDGLYDEIYRENNVEASETRIFMLLGEISRRISKLGEGRDSIHLIKKIRGIECEITARVVSDSIGAESLLIGFSEELRIKRIAAESASVIAGLNQMGQKEFPSFIDHLLSYATQARRDGILSLEGCVQQENDQRLKGGLELIMEACDPVDLRSYFEEQTRSPGNQDTDWFKIKLFEITCLEIQRGTNPQLLRELLEEIAEEKDK